MNKVLRKIEKEGDKTAHKVVGIKKNCICANEKMSYSYSANAAFIQVLGILAEHEVLAFQELLVLLSLRLLKSG